LNRPTIDLHISEALYSAVCINPYWEYYTKLPPAKAGGLAQRAPVFKKAAAPARTRLKQNHWPNSPALAGGF
jgi:hypothetical protein